MRVEMGGRVLRQRLEALDLRGDLALDVVSFRTRGRPARVAHEGATAVDQRGATRERLAEREVDVQTEAEAGVARARNDARRHVAVHQHRRARHDAVAMRGEDTRADARREAEIVGVDDQPPRHAGCLR